MKKPFTLILAAAIVSGAGAFALRLAGDHPERAWQAYLINFLLWSAVAQGGLLFSAVMHTVKARWSGPLSSLSESFAAFFPISLLLFLLLFLGKTHIFPWRGQDLHGKEVWLNIPFLFSRDLIGLILLYGVGVAYLYCALGCKLNQVRPEGNLSDRVYKHWNRHPPALEGYRKGMRVWGILYILSFALVLSLLGYDLVMSMDPHWYSTLFGAYTFVKAFFVGLGGLIILAAIQYLRQGERSGLAPAHFHDIGKLFFGFCLMWADFFYVQFVVIWYGNIPEETGYIIERILTPPWQTLAWIVFILAFVVPFLILLNRKVKTLPRVMIPLCGGALTGIWLEHLLLVGPALNRHAQSVPLDAADGLITLGFLGLMVLAVGSYIRLFPELFVAGEKI